MMSQICPTPTELALLVLIILITLFTVIAVIAAIVIIIIVVVVTIVVVIVVIIVIVLINRAYDFIQIVLKIALKQHLKGPPPPLLIR